MRGAVLILAAGLASAQGVQELVTQGAEVYAKA